MTRGYEACSGCGICTMVCPVAWETGDVWYTPHGRARALQGGANAEDLAESVRSCRMCGACEPACPERIDILAMVRRLRVQLNEANGNPFIRDGTDAAAANRGRLLLAGPVLGGNLTLLDSVVECLGGVKRIRVAADDGRDLAWALEAGARIDDERIDRFVASLGKARELIVIEGMLHRFLRERGLRVRGFAEALLDSEAMLSVLGPRDLLVIETRAYHVDHDRLVTLFGRLRSRTGCQMNLDLQRLAIPTGADSLHVRGNGDETCKTAISWMLEGRNVDRIVVESPADLGALTAHTDVPVEHLSSAVSEKLRR